MDTSLTPILNQVGRPGGITLAEAGSVVVTWGWFNPLPEVLRHVPAIGTVTLGGASNLQIRKTS
jgi:hypothetical protein